MVRFFGHTIVFGALVALISLTFAVPQARAVEEMRQFNKDDTKGGKTTSCPKGQRFSQKKGGCVRTGCAAGQVWSSGADACLGGNSASLTDDDLYLAGRDLGQEGHYAEALKLFFRIKDLHQARVLNSIGYSTRKLGDLDKGIEYYHQALAIDPNFTKARQYLGEAYLQKGDVAKAKEQLIEIANRCGGPCDDYELLVKAIAAHVSGEKNIDWQF